MENAEVIAKLRQRMSRMFSYKILVRRLAYHFNAYSARLQTDRYSERTETGPQNVDLKVEREQQGGPFEPYSMQTTDEARAAVTETTNYAGRYATAHGGL